MIGQNEVAGDRVCRRGRGAWERDIMTRIGYCTRANRRVFYCSSCRKTLMVYEWSYVFVARGQDYCLRDMST